MSISYPSKLNMYNWKIPFQKHPFSKDNLTVYLIFGSVRVKIILFYRIQG